MTVSFLRSGRIAPLLISLGAFALVVSVARSAPDEKPWTSYGGGADSSRFLDSKQITKANVSQLDVAWSYRCDLPRAVVDNRARRIDVALVPRPEEIWIHEGMQTMTTRGMNYWEQGRKGPPADLQHERLPAGSTRTQQVDHDVWHRGVDLRGGLGRDRPPWRAFSRERGRVFENLVLLGSVPAKLRICRAAARLRRRHGQRPGSFTRFTPGEFGCGPGPRRLEIRQDEPGAGNHDRRRRGHRLLSIASPT